MSSRVFCGSYYYLDAWVLAHCVAIFTRRFCERFLTSQNDPKGRHYDQMYMAARSVYANIAEGSARHTTSTETEMRLLDVARGSAIELSEDLMQLVIEQQGEIWPANHPAMHALHQVPFIHTDYEEAKAAAKADESVQYLIACYFGGYYGDDAGLINLVSVAPKEGEILLGIQHVFEVYLKD